MSHVLLMLCGHVQDKDLYTSHNMKSYIWKYFFSLHMKARTPGMYPGLHWRSWFPWYAHVVCKERLFSRYDLVQDLDQLSWLCWFFLLSVQPHQLYTYSKPTFLLLLLAGMKVFSRHGPVALQWATYPIVWPHISIHEFSQMLPIHLAFRTGLWTGYVPAYERWYVIITINPWGEL